MSDRVRVRYAPSPTGYLHIGNALEQHYLTIYLPNIMMEILLSVLKIQIVNVI
jgi:hypothetical protein